MFELGTKVVTVRSDKYNSPAGHKGHITAIMYSNGISGEILYQVRGDSNYVYSYEESKLRPLKVQKLYAYLDSTQEVHWATKVYSEKELGEFGFKKASEYDKTIELE